MIQHFRVFSVHELDQVASKLLELSTTHRVFAFFGPMGAGKTTLIKTVCRMLGTGENVSSPTFSLVNEYLTVDGEPVYHFDFYRIERIEEAFDIGYEYYFFSNYLCLIEWPEKILQLLPESYVKISLKQGADDSEREIEISWDNK